MLRLLAVSIIVAPVTLAAQEPVRVLGLGGQSCGAWVTNSPTKNPSGIGLLYEQWVAGFLSGVIYSQPDGSEPIATMGAAAVDQWMDDYCKSSPQAKLAEAAIAFVRQHAKTKPQSR